MSPLLRNATGLLQTATGLATSDCAPECLLGACCLPGGSCNSLTESECLAAGGTFYGCNSLCDDVECGGGVPCLCCTGSAICTYSNPVSALVELSGSITYRWGSIPGPCDCGTITFPLSVSEILSLNQPLPNHPSYGATVCNLRLDLPDAIYLQGSGYPTPPETGECACAIQVLKKVHLGTLPCDPTPCNRSECGREMWAELCAGFNGDGSRFIRVVEGSQVVGIGGIPTMIGVGSIIKVVPAGSCASVESTSGTQSFGSISAGSSPCGAYFQRTLTITNASVTLLSGISACSAGLAFLP